jgi:hypothetical protein
LALAPKFQKTVSEQLKEQGIDRPDLEDYLNLDINLFGLSYLLQCVIMEVEHVGLDVIDDYEGKIYMLICPHYPWTKTAKEEREVGSTKEADALFKKYTSILTDECIPANYQNVECCC